MTDDSTPVSGIGLTPYKVKYLLEGGIDTVGKLRDLSDPELMRFPGFGRKTIERVRAIAPRRQKALATDDLAAYLESILSNKPPKFKPGSMSCSVKVNSVNVVRLAALILEAYEIKRRS